ncbi:MAG TPA: radical SAM protein [Methanomassiliicoccales archaeon]|nr:radical SAM protein [Methanomassiliicoccales archaeon]
MSTRLLFVEPPKDYLFLMGDYLPPPTALLALGAYAEREIDDLEIEVIDCQAESLDWKALEKRIEAFEPDVVAASGFTCNAYTCAKVAEISKKIDKDIVTALGGQHFSYADVESMHEYPEIDFIVRGEGERTLVHLLRALRDESDLTSVDGLTFRHGNEIVQNRPRELIENLDELPFPAYHLLEKNLDRYHFTMMAGKGRYMITEGSRGCFHRCGFCTQWKHWGARWRTKSPKRIAEDMARLRDDYGAGFVWLTDDNFEFGKRGKELAAELKARGFNESNEFFFQARTDDIASHPDEVAKLAAVGNNWQLVGVENNSPEFLKQFHKGERVEDARKAVGVLKDNGVLAQAMVIIGSRSDTHESIKKLREYTLDLDPELAIFSCLTPMPGTELYDEAKRNRWLDDKNLAHYDMAHAIMPTETLTRSEVQEELYVCYRQFFGTPTRVLKGLFSSNDIKKRCFRHLAGKRIMYNLRQMI